MHAELRCCRAGTLLLILAATPLGCQLAFPTNHFERGRDAGGSDTNSTGDWCAAQDAGYRLCDDFDGPGGVTQGFDIGLVPVPGSVGGSFTLDSTSFVSSPHSALGTANPFGPGQVSGDRIVGTLWSLGPTPSKLNCSLMWRPVALSTTPNDFAHVLAVNLCSDAGCNSSVAGFSINMQADGTLILFEYYNNQPSLNATFPIGLTVKRGKWYPVSFSLASSGSSSTFRVKMGGVGPGGPTAAPLPATSSATFEFGPSYFAGTTTAPSPGWTFGYDNIVCY